MKEYRQSNLYTPNFSRLIAMKRLKQLETTFDSDTLESDKHMHKYRPPNGLADTCLQNSPYQQLLIELDIVSYTSDDAFVMIYNELKGEQNKSSNEIEINITDSNDQQSNKNYHYFQNLKTKAVYLWKSKKYLNREIAFKLGLEEIMVDKYIKEYKRAVITLLKLNRLKAAKKKIAITPNKIEEIRLFWIKNVAKGVITINDVKKEVWKIMMKTVNHEIQR